MKKLWQEAATLPGDSMPDRHRAPILNALYAVFDYMEMGERVNVFILYDQLTSKSRCASYECAGTTARYYNSILWQNVTLQLRSYFRLCRSGMYPALNNMSQNYTVWKRALWHSL